jgi:ribose-phosphate pyrophosphokinase
LTCRARAFAKKLNDAPLAIVDKRRSAHNVSEVMNLIGDVKGKVAVLVDDMIDTAGTITNAAKVLRAEGAKEVYACASHAVFSPPAVERLSSGVFEEVIVTNTIPVALVSCAQHRAAVEAWDGHQMTACCANSGGVSLRPSHC